MKNKLPTKVKIGVVVVGAVGTIICVVMSVMALHTVLTATDLHPMWTILGLYMGLFGAPVLAIANLIFLKDEYTIQGEA